jgi:hypothetical protein
VVFRMRFEGGKAYKKVYINSGLTRNHIPIKNYASFLKEIS